MITSGAAFKALATASASAGILGLGPMAWVFAIIGAFFSVYLENAKEPKEAMLTIINILAYAFAAALIALVLPHIDFFGIGKAAAAIPVEARAGILGLSIRWAVANGKTALSAKVKGWGDK